MIWLKKWIGDQIWVDLREEFFFRQYTINVLVSLAVLFSDLLKGTIEDCTSDDHFLYLPLIYGDLTRGVISIFHVVHGRVDSDRWLQLLISDVRWIFWRLDVFSFKFLWFVGLWNPIRIGNHHHFLGSDLFIFVRKY